MVAYLQILGEEKVNIYKRKQGQGIHDERMGIFLSRKMLSAAGRCEFKLGPWLPQFDIL